MFEIAETLLHASAACACRAEEEIARTVSCAVKYVKRTIHRRRRNV